jgi:hypothetical protein
MKPTTKFLTDCGHRMLALRIRGLPRQQQQLDALAAECGIVIGSLCHTTEKATELTQHMVRNPLPRWDFRAFRERAEKFVQTPAHGKIFLEAQEEQVRQWYADRAVAQATFHKLPPHKQQSLTLAWRRKIDAALETDPDGDFRPPWKYAGGASMRLRTLVNLADYVQQLEQMAVSDIMEKQYQESFPSPQNSKAQKSPT